MLISAEAGPGPWKRARRPSAKAAAAAVDDQAEVVNAGAPRRRIEEAADPASQHRSKQVKRSAVSDPAPQSNGSSHDFALARLGEALALWSQSDFDAIGAGFASETTAHAVPELTEWLATQADGVELYVGTQDQASASGTVQNPLSVGARLNGIEPNQCREMGVALSNGQHRFVVEGRDVARALAQNPGFSVVTDLRAAPAKNDVKPSRLRAKSKLACEPVGFKPPPFSTKDILTSSHSILGEVDLRHIISLEAFVHALTPEDRALLYPMLPTLDTKNPANLVKFFQSNMQFLSCLNLFRDMLVTGAYDPEYRAKARSKRRRQAGWSEEKERIHEAFYGLNLEPKPTDAIEAAKWAEFDAQMIALGTEALEKGKDAHPVLKGTR